MNEDHFAQDRQSSLSHPQIEYIKKQIINEDKRLGQIINDYYYMKSQYELKQKELMNYMFIKQSEFIQKIQNLQQQMSKIQIMTGNQEYNSIDQKSNHQEDIENILQKNQSNEIFMTNIKNWLVKIKQIVEIDIQNKKNVSKRLIKTERQNNQYKEQEFDTTSNEDTQHLNIKNMYNQQSYKSPINLRKELNAIMEQEQSEEHLFFDKNDSEKLFLSLQKNTFGESRNESIQQYPQLKAFDSEENFNISNEQKQSKIIDIDTVFKISPINKELSFNKSALQKSFSFRNIQINKSLKQQNQIKGKIKHLDIIKSQEQQIEQIQKNQNKAPVSFIQQQKDKNAQQYDLFKKMKVNTLQRNQTLNEVQFNQINKNAHKDKISSLQLQLKQNQDDYWSSKVENLMQEKKQLIRNINMQNKKLDQTIQENVNLKKQLIKQKVQLDDQQLKNQVESYIQNIFTKSNHNDNENLDEIYKNKLLQRSLTVKNLNYE